MALITSAWLQPRAECSFAIRRAQAGRRDALTEHVRSPLLALIAPATAARDPDTIPLCDRSVLSCNLVRAQSR
jgi:hypothetical protein